MVLQLGFTPQNGKRSVAARKKCKCSKFSENHHFAEINEISNAIRYMNKLDRISLQLKILIKLVVFSLAGQEIHRIFRGHKTKFSATGEITLSK